VEESGGRFLRFDEATRTWEQVDAKSAHEKVSHALRSARDPNRPRERRIRVETVQPPTPEEDAMFNRVHSIQQAAFADLMDRQQDDPEAYLMTTEDSNDSMLVSQAPRFQRDDREP